MEPDQKPLYTAQFAVTIKLDQQYSLSAGYFYTFGGELSVDGQAQGNENATHRYQLTGIAQYPIGRFILQYGGDLKRENGFFEERRPFSGIAARSR